MTAEAAVAQLCAGGHRQEACQGAGLICFGFAARPRRRQPSAPDHAGLAFGVLHLRRWGQIGGGGGRGGSWPPSPAQSPPPLEGGYFLYKDNELAHDSMASRCRCENEQVPLDLLGQGVLRAPGRG